MNASETIPAPDQANPQSGTGAKAPKSKSRRRMWIILVSHFVGLLTSVHALMGVRTAQGAIAWVVSLNTLPYVAVPAYWILGRSKFHGYVIARRLDDAKVAEFARDYSKTLDERNLIRNPDRDRAYVVEKLAKLPFTTGNDAELLVDGDATFQSIFEGISKAEKYVLVQFYIIRDDEVGQELKTRLLERAKAGVACYLLYDEIGSSLPRAYTDELKQAGISVFTFNTRQGEANRFQINFRNHRKIVITDGRAAWVGGLNVGREYKGLDPKIGYWRDTHLRLAGPVVHGIQVSFLEDWHWASGSEIHGLSWDPQPAASGASRSVMCLPSSPADSLETCTLFFLDAINRAKTRLWIASPYFVPDEQFISALQLAALRGVEVRILIPENADNPLVQYSA